MSSIKYPLVSVVITTKNEEKNIENCLSSICKQSYPQKYIEVLVIDNNSTDNTKYIAKKYTPLVFDHGPERSAQRNYGAKIATGKFILFLDADMTLSLDVVKECVEKCDRDLKLAALYIPEVIIGSSFFSKIRKFERGFYNGTVIDCVRFVKMSIFKKINGFDESMSGPEDWDFDKKIRAIGNTAIASAALYHDEHDMTLKRYIEKKSYYAKSFDTYVKKWGIDDADITKQLGVKYRFLQVFIEQGKWKRLIMHPFLTIGMYTLKIIVGVAFLNVKYQQSRSR